MLHSVVSHLGLMKLSRKRRNAELVWSHTVLVSVPVDEGWLHAEGPHEALHWQPQEWFLA